MTWKYQTGDKYSKKQLLGFREFFRKDLESAINEVNKAYMYEKYGLPNWRNVILRRQMGVEEATQNMIIVNQALKEHGIDD